MFKQRNLLIGFAAIYAIRLLLTQFMGLMPQDAYYYFYSEDMALSYFDHPPMVAYMLRMFSLVLGKSVVAVKLTNLIVTVGTVYGFYYLCQFFLSKAQSIKATLFFGSTLLSRFCRSIRRQMCPCCFFGRSR